MKVGLYRVIATIEFPVYEADVFLTREVRAPKVEGLVLRQYDLFRVIESKSHDDGFVRALITVAGRIVSIKVGEGIPSVAFQNITDLPS